MDKNITTLSDTEHRRDFAERFTAEHERDLNGRFRTMAEMATLVTTDVADGLRCYNGPATPAMNVVSILITTAGLLGVAYLLARAIIH